MQLLDDALLLDREAGVRDDDPELCVTDGVDRRALRTRREAGIRLVEVVPGRLDGPDAVRKQHQSTTWRKNCCDLRQRTSRLHPVEGLGEHDEVECSACRLPFLECRLLDAQAFRNRHLRHARVRFYRKDVSAGLRQLC